jgi:hypothetical protein
MLPVWWNSADMPRVLQTTNPTWEGHEFVLFPGVTNRDFLNKRFIRIVVKVRLFLLMSLSRAMH